MDETFDPDLIRAIFKLVWSRRTERKDDTEDPEIEVGAATSKKTRPTTANPTALKVSCELLRLFVTEAIERAAIIAEAEAIAIVTVEYENPPYIYENPPDSAGGFGRRAPFAKFFSQVSASAVAARAAASAAVPTALLPYRLPIIRLFIAPITAAQLYDPRRLPSRYAFQSAHPRRLLPKRYLLDETKSTATNPEISNTTSPALAPPHSSTDSSFSNQQHRSHKHKMLNWILCFITSWLAVVAGGMFLYAIFWLVVNCTRGRGRRRYWNPDPDRASIFSPKQIKRADLAFLEKDDGLVALEVIGRGGCGEVYKAKLPPDPARPDKPGMVIAIKKITRRSAEPTNDEESGMLDKWMRQMRSEIQTVGHIRHRSLLPLLAHLPLPDCHLLIYEFMKQGDLEAALHAVRAGESELDWPTRHRIALGIAVGLEYLHAHHKPQIIHRDLKPANILLGDNMEARIADFGLAKEMRDTQTHVTASKVAGTLGYIAPEYWQTQQFSPKCDIYSFGVILAALVIGRLPSDDFFQETEELSLVLWLRNVMASGNVAVAIDPRLEGNGFEEQMQLVLWIAVSCTVDDPEERPNSEEVRARLGKVIKEDGVH